MQDCRRGLPQRVKVRPHAWVPGELLLAVHADLPTDGDSGVVVSTVRERVRKVLGDIPVESPVGEDPPLWLPTLRGNQHLLFVHFRLGTPEPRTMRQALARLNGQTEPGSFGTGVDLVAATPNWFGAAQQDCAGGSPASHPAPVEVFGSRVRYAPRLEDLARHADEGPITVAVLDSAPDAADIAWARGHFSTNRQLHDVLERLQPPVGGLDAPDFEAARQAAMQTLDADGGFHPVELVEPYDVRDHGLFVASVAHAAAPWAPLRLVRVLNNFGAGSLRSLVIGLVGLVHQKPPEARLVINLSLGMLPPLEQLPAMFFGFSIPGLNGSPEDPALQFSEDHPHARPAELRKIAESGDAATQRTLHRLHRPLSELMTVLQAHNVLVVAAAGNDSVFRGVNRRPRWRPRLPALYDTVLGVAADTVQPGAAARYSNRGELQQVSVRDAVATLGGDLAADGISPVSGVIGVYTAEQFPGSGVVNDSGWAQWSGTSFAAPIMAGIAANVWANQPGLSSRDLLARLNAATRPPGHRDVEGLGVPGVPVSLTWLP